MENKIPVFIDNAMKTYFPDEVIFCDIDTPGPQFIGYVTLESFEKSNCIDKWVGVKIIPSVKKDSWLIVKSVQHHKES